MQQQHQQVEITGLFEPAKIAHAKAFISWRAVLEYIGRSPTSKEVTRYTYASCLDMQWRMPGDDVSNAMVLRHYHESWLFL